MLRTIMDRFTPDMRLAVIAYLATMAAWLLIAALVVYLIIG